MESQTARNGEAGLPRRREPDLASLATFTLDPSGLVTSWSVTATRLFGHPAGAVTGRDVCEVISTSGRCVAHAARRRIDAELLWQSSARTDRIVSPTRRMSLGGTTLASASSSSAPPTENVRCMRFST